MVNGFMLLYRRFEDGRLEWPRSTQEAAELTEEQFHLLMHGFDPVTVRIRDVEPKKII
jgi:transposase